MTRNAKCRKRLLSWIGNGAALAMVAVVAAVPMDVRGAPKTAAKKGTAAKESPAGETKSATENEGEKDSAEKAAPAATAGGSIKLPEQFYSTGYNGSYVELIN